MEIKQLVVGLIGTNCYIIHLSDGRTVLVDPGDAPDMIISDLERLDFIVLTHAHWDHLLALPAIVKQFPQAKLCVHPKALYSTQEQLDLLGSMNPYLKIRFHKTVEDLPSVDTYVEEGSLIGPFKVLHTPGHESGSICLYSEEDRVLFSGDTLFASGYGRTDFTGGNEQELFNSLRRLRTLPPETVLYPGHGPISTLGDAFGAIGF